MSELQVILRASSARHKHLCPRQVLGARTGLAGAAALGLTLPRTDKRLLVILETDGCFADGVEVATGCTVGHRTLRVADYGKTAATFIDVNTEQAVRVFPQFAVRERAYAYALDEPRHYFAQLQAYQVMPDAELLTVQAVTLRTPVAVLVSRPGIRVNCTQCGEEIINEREVLVDSQPYCRACVGQSYYQLCAALSDSTNGQEMALPTPLQTTEHHLANGRYANGTDGTSCLIPALYHPGP